MRVFLDTIGKSMKEDEPGEQDCQRGEKSEEPNAFTFDVLRFLSSEK
jgi:hypothetical protein